LDQWKDIDLLAGTLTVRRSIHRVRSCRQPADVHLMRKTIIMTIAAAALTAGCGGGDSAEATAQATEFSMSATAPESATAAAPSTTAPAMDAATALANLKDAGLPITDSAVITETNDANDLIGRPGQYVSKVAFADSRLGVPIDPAEPGNEGGGSIEVFADGADAQARSDYIQATLQSLGPIAGTEYHYLTGPILVRVTGELPPSVAAEYEAAVAGLS
jgi:hypothetical protein